MKKILVCLILFFCPVFINATTYNSGISNYYMDATVLENGDLKIKELFFLNGSYNGFERIINYRNSNAPLFTGVFEDLKGSSIYNGDNIEIVSVKGISCPDETFDCINNDGYEFKETDYASSGDYGVYYKNVETDGNTLRIFNPSNENQGFYVEYLIKNMAISHNDVSEIGWNLFSDQLTESVNNLEVLIHIPTNQDLLRVWAHGPLWGSTEIIDNNTLKVKIHDLDAYEAIDTRFIFDSSAINTNKVSNLTAMDEIIRIETELADQANKDREQAIKDLEDMAIYMVEKAEKKKSTETYESAYYYTNQLPDGELKTSLFERLKKVEKAIENKKIISSAITGVWGLGLIALIIYNYQKNDKEYESSFNVKYYREIPKDYGPNVLAKLLNKGIGDSELSASILNLVAKGAFTVEEVEGKKKDYMLIAATPKEKLSPSEEHIVIWLLDGKTEVLLSTIKDEAKKSYSDFLKNYETWKELANSESSHYNFFEKTAKNKWKYVLYSLLGIFLVTLPFNGEIYNITVYVTIAASVIALIYFASYTRRTKEGNEDYRRWMSFKNFLNDFGNFEAKELPEIVLWEKFLVYATVFGIAKKLAKTMELKVKELEEIGTNVTMFDYMMYNRLLRTSSAISRDVTGAVAAARSEKARVETANSSSSSGGGFGGGFSGGSGGGGSFGGGGGGGRF